MKTGLNHKDGRPYREAPPGWGLTSREAANLLGCTPASARTWLHRRKVPYRIVCEAGQTLRIFWRKDKVLSLAENRLPVVSNCPSSFISAVDALSILHVGRSSLHRYQERGQLSVFKVRYPSGKGLRQCSYFKRDEVEKLAKSLELMRRKEAQLRRMRRNTLLNPPAESSAIDHSIPRIRKRNKKKSD